jgi:DNA repair protein RadA/Sms
MTVATIIFACTNCGSQFSKWSGRCDECGSWNTLAREEGMAGGVDVVSGAGDGARIGIPKPDVRSLSDVGEVTYDRISSGLSEVDRVLGGGFVSGGLSVIAGSPGIGKSTLVLQIAHHIAVGLKKGFVLYASGEESLSQIGMRAKRLGLDSKRFRLVQTSLIDSIEQIVRKEQPAFLIVDSVQTMAVGGVPQIAGSVTQVKASTDRLMRLVKPLHIPTVIVSHVTKQGIVAGPKMLEHMVDVVLYIEGDRHHEFRVLRASKNRFGSTGETGMFEMKQRGMIEVKNPSKLFLANRAAGGPGSVIGAIMEGSRPLLLEIQALTQDTVFGYPKRTANGISLKRVELLLAVLSRRAGLDLANQDVYVNVVGGFDVRDRGLDLALCLAIASSFQNKAVDAHALAFGEVGLLGEVRSVGFMEQRMKEAIGLGFTTMVVPDVRVRIPAKIASAVTVAPVKTIQDALARAFV